MTCCCAHEKSRNGTTQNVTASTVMCAHTTSRRGRRSRLMTTKTASVSAPRISRDHATWAGDRPVSAVFMKRKLEPQMMPQSTNCTAIDAGDDVTASRAGAVEAGAVLTRVTLLPAADVAPRPRVRRPKPAEERQSAYDCRSSRGAQGSGCSAS